MRVSLCHGPLSHGPLSQSIVKQFLDANTASKVEFLSKLSDLSEKLGDMSTMPDFLGGQVPEDVAYDAG